MSNANHCKAKTKSGKPCRAAATAGGLCFFHANPNKASELGRIGGRRNRHLAGENPEAPPLALESANDVRETVARLITDLYGGKLHPRIAACLGPLLHLHLRAIEKTGGRAANRRTGGAVAKVDIGHGDAQPTNERRWRAPNGRRSPSAGSDQGVAAC